MKSVRMATIVVGLVTWVVFFGSTGIAQFPPNTKPFLVFDGTLYSDKPDFSVHRIRPITLAYAGKFGPDWHKQADHPLRAPTSLTVR